LLARFRQNYGTDFDQTSGDDWGWQKLESISFWWWSGSGAGFWITLKDPYTLGDRALFQFFVNNSENNDRIAYILYAPNPYGNPY
jgi:hypothetical protein